MCLFKSRRKQNKIINWKIKDSCLKLILEASRSSHPREFGALLRIDEENKEMISEVVLLPGTISGDSHAIFRMHMLPIDFSIVGTVHSHPSSNLLPSGADLDLFRKYGKLHIIVAYPYDKSSWKCYNYKGEEIKLEIV